MPEIERENILASRLEEMQKFKDSQQLDAMYKMAGMGNEDEEDDDDDEPRKRRRSLFLSISLTKLISQGKHTSMTKEASRAIKDLKNKRKAKEERATQRVSSLFRSDVGSKS